MKKLHFSVTINAPAANVWKALWEDKNYRDWTSVFTEGSYAVSNWNEGDEVLFLSPNGDGMHSRIARSIPNEYMSFEHLGMMKDGKQMAPDEQSREWVGAKENYTLEEADGVTTLKVDMDTTPESEPQFNKMFPDALAGVKRIAES